MEPALKTVYKDRVVPGLNEKFTYGNVHRIPAIQKVVLNVVSERLGTARLRPRR